MRSLLLALSLSLALAGCGEPTPKCLVYPEESGSVLPSCYGSGEEFESDAEDGEYWMPTCDQPYSRGLYCDEDSELRCQDGSEARCELTVVGD